MYSIMKLTITLLLKKFSVTLTLYLFVKGLSKTLRQLCFQ